MKHIHKLRILTFGILILLFSCTGNQRKQIDENRFCDNLNSFLDHLETLNETSEGTDIDAFNKAYDKTERAWDKLVNSAADLEDVEIDQVEKAYNKLVKQINKIENDSKITDPAYQIAEHIDSTVAEIDNILTTVCKE